jgi:drug/metabolite transporter (DMT)-like permease
MGVVLALVGALGFSFMNVFIRNGVRPGDPDNGVLTTMLINVSIFAMLSVVIVAIGDLPEISIEAIAWLAASGVAAAFLGRQALFGGIRRIGAARAAAIKNVTPLVTIAIALTFLGERLTVLDGVGSLLILIGLFALIIESIRSTPRSPGEAAHPDPIQTAFESEGLAEAGFWGRTQGLASRTAALISEPARRRIVLGITLSLVSALFIGSGHAFRKLGMDLMPHAIIAAFLAASTGLVLVVLFEAVRGNARHALRSSLTSVRPWFWAAGVTGGIGQVSFFAALAFAPVSHVSVVAGSETVLTVIIAALLAGRLEAITGRVVLPAVLVFAGTALIGVANA